MKNLSAIDFCVDIPLNLLFGTPSNKNDKDANIYYNFINKRESIALFKSIRCEIQNSHKNGFIDKRKAKQVFVKMGLISPKMKV